MTPGLLLLGLAGAVLGAVAVRTYLRHEPPVRGRGFLAGLRVGVILLVLLLFWNPAVRAPMEAAGPSWYVIDGTLGMTALDREQRSPWHRVIDYVDAGESGTASLLLLDESAARALPEEALLAHEPTRPGSELADAVRSALERGASQVTVLSDLRVRDRESVTRALGRVPVRFVELAGEPRNAGILRFELPRSIESDAPVEGVIEVFGESASAADSVRVEVREEDALVFSEWLPLPPIGARERISVELPPPGGEGSVRYEAQVELEGDGFPWDDVAVAYAEVDRDPGGVVLLSLRPDWEPRFLLPVLGDATGLEERGYLSVGEGRFLPLVFEGTAAEPVEEGEVREVLERAELLVLHGISGDAPEWVAELATTSSRLLFLPADRAAADLGGLVTGPAQDGEWFVDPLVPASPVAPYLGERIQGGDRLPPLSGVLALEEAPPGPVPLVARREARGEPQAVVVFREEDGRRVATGLAQGYWRWAMRPGEHRDTYRRFWAGVSAWLVAGDPMTAAAEVRPEEPVLSPHDPVRWAAPGRAGEEVRVRIRASPASPGDEWATDTVLQVDAPGRFETSRLPSGTYEYDVEAAGEPETSLGSGRFDLLVRSLELSVPVWEPEERQELRAEGAALPAEDGRGLRTHPAPWILLLLLLCTEWVGRRRLGLR